MNNTLKALWNMYDRQEYFYVIYDYRTGLYESKLFFDEDDAEKYFNIMVERDGQPPSALYIEQIHKDQLDNFPEPTLFLVKMGECDIIEMDALFDENAIKH